MNTSLLHIELGGMACRSISLSSYLPLSSSLLMLIIAGSNIQEDGITALLGAMKVNFTVQKLYIRLNSHYDAQRTELNHYCARNQAIKQLPIAGIPSHLVSPHLTYTLLRKIPYIYPSINEYCGGYSRVSATTSSRQWREKNTEGGDPWAWSNRKIYVGKFFEAQEYAFFSGINSFILYQKYSEDNCSEWKIRAPENMNLDPQLESTTVSYKSKMARSRSWISEGSWCIL